jgi:hypothetical protein
MSPLLLQDLEVKYQERLDRLRQESGAVISHFCRLVGAS